MPQPTTVKFPVPESASEFEKLATDVAGRLFRCRFQRHAGPGDAQDGVDAYAMPKAGVVLGLQHKNCKLTVAQIEHEIAAAERFEPTLTEFILMTSSPRKASVQRHARRLRAERQGAGRFSVEVLFWEDICEELSGHSDLVEKYYSPLLSKSHHRRLGADRVEKWVHYVLNPLIAGLDRERFCLQRGSVSWRFYTRSVERVFMVRSYVDDARTFEDFLRANRTVERTLVERDDAVRVAIKAAANAFDDIVAQGPFRTAVSRKLKVFNADRDSPVNPGGAFPLDKLPMLVAQRVVNNDGELPGDHTDREFWARFGGEFKRFGQRDSATSLRAAAQHVFEHNQRLRNMLSELHFQMCDEYGVRPAP